MKFIINSILISIILIIAANKGIGQVQYELEYNKSSQLYTVSVISDKTYTEAERWVSTAQVTLKVPSGNFDVIDFQNLIPNVEFELNGFTESPNEAPEFDYLSFGLTTTGSKIAFVEEEKIALFQFKNGLGCTGEISLMENASDPFRVPNSRRLNVGNQMTILGAGGDAYSGMIGDGKVDCSIVRTNEIEPEYSLVLFPNPISNKLTLFINDVVVSEEISLKILDSIGKKGLIQKEVFLSEGDNKVEISVNHLPQGSYHLMIENNQSEVQTISFIKM